MPDNLYEVFTCGVCRNIYPTIHRNIHHIKPRSVGGPDTLDNLIDLCPSCHDALHSIAHKLLNKKYSESTVIDSIGLIYKEDLDARRMCYKLAKNVRDALIKSKESALDPDQLVQISAVIKKRHKQYIAIWCKENRISQERYFRQLVLADIARKFNLGASFVSEGLSDIENYKRK